MAVELLRLPGHTSTVVSLLEKLVVVLTVSTRHVLLLFRDLEKKGTVHQPLSEAELPNGDDRKLTEVLEEGGCCL